MSASPSPIPPPALLAAARAAAARHALAPELVCAVIEQESAWRPYALRYEPDFYERYVAPLLLKNAPPRNASGAPYDVNMNEGEARARAFSWGLMQVMGQAAREHGFAGASLAELCDPATGCEIGCRVLAAKLAAAAGDVPRALLLWNGGARAAYAAEVLARVPRYAA